MAKAEGGQSRKSDGNRSRTTAGGAVATAPAPVSATARPRRVCGKPNHPAGVRHVAQIDSTLNKLTPLGAVKSDERAIKKPAATAAAEAAEQRSKR